MNIFLAITLLTILLKDGSDENGVQATSFPLIFSSVKKMRFNFDSVVFYAYRWLYEGR